MQKIMQRPQIVVAHIVAEAHFHGTRLAKDAPHPDNALSERIVGTFWGRLR